MQVEILPKDRNCPKSTIILINDSYRKDSRYILCLQERTHDTPTDSTFWSRQCVQYYNHSEPENKYRVWLPGCPHGPPIHSTQRRQCWYTIIQCQTSVQMGDGACDQIFLDASSNVPTPTGRESIVNVPIATQTTTTATTIHCIM